jgi:hypothetical protein
VAAIHANVCLKGQQFALFIPPLFALIVGCSLRRDDRRKGDPGLPSFFATRPISTSALVSAQLKMAALSTLAAWGIIGLYVGAWLLPPAREGTVAGPLIVLLLQHTTMRSGMVLLLGLASLMVWTWKSQVQTLFVDLAGRAWAACAYPIGLAGFTTALLLLSGASGDRDLFLIAVFLVPLLLALVALRAWIAYGYLIGAAGLTLALLVFLKLAHASQPEILAIRGLMPGAAAFVLMLKLLAAGGTLYLLRRRGRVAATDLVKLVAVWLLIAAASFGLLRALVPDTLLPGGSLALAVALLLPFTQLALAPLVLTSIRHR